MDNPSAEAGWLVGEVAALDLPALARRTDERVPGEALARLGDLVEGRRRGEPLQYLLGHWAFRGLELRVDRRVLIPRPETEVVTGVAIETLRGAGLSGPLTAVDLGTGSGAIALALADELPGVEVWAVERSPAALEVAAANVAASGLPAARRPRLLAGSWFDPLPGALRGLVSLVVSNPPYVATGEWAGLPAAVRDHEPEEALVAGESGLEALGAVVEGALPWLAPGGVLVCELAPHQATSVAALAEGVGLVSVEVRPDLAGRARVLVARRAPSPP